MTLEEAAVKSSKVPNPKRFKDLCGRKTQPVVLPRAPL